MDTTDTTTDRISRAIGSGPDDPARIIEPSRREHPPLAVPESLLQQLDAFALLLDGIPERHLDLSYTVCGSCHLKHFEAFDEMQLARSIESLAAKVRKVRHQLATLDEKEAPEAAPSRYADESDG
jgi:hypothetical protein